MGPHDEMNEPGAQRSTSDSTGAEDATEEYEYTALERFRDRIQFDLDHSEHAKTIPLCRGNFKMARARQEQAYHFLKLPKVGGDFDEPSAEERLKNANLLAGSAINTFGRRKQRKPASSEQHGNK